MGIFSNLFGQKKSTNTDVFSKYAVRALKSLDMPINDANKLKVTVYLCFAQMALLHLIAKGAANVFIDKMVEDAKDSILDLQMKVKDLAKNNDELIRILSDFPEEAGVTGDTTVNGLAAWDAVYLTYVEEVVPEMASRPTGPMAPYAYPAIKIQEAMQGTGPSSDKLMERVQVITEMTGEVIKAFR
jgi:hypothetical protein